MRLIDADKLIKDIKELWDYKTVLKQTITDIENQPTVKAIPIEWIEEWQNKHEWENEYFFRMIDGRPMYAVECMLHDWEKENET